MEAAGGRRFVKGLSGKDLEAWRNTAESLAACGADVESGEARLAEDVDQFEGELSRVNAEIAAEKVGFSSAKYSVPPTWPRKRRCCSSMYAEWNVLACYR